MTYFALAWAVIAAGLVPAVVFLVVFRPAQWVRSAQLDANGWVIVVAMFYVQGVIGLVAGAPTPMTVPAVTVTLLRLGTDWLLWRRLLLWWRWRREFTARRSGLG